MSRIDQINRRIRDHIRGRYEMIDVLPKQGLFNHKCFYNAVEYALGNHEMEVIEVAYIENSLPILHYINRCESGLFYETTLGHRAPHLEYYFIRKIHPDDYKRIGAEFDTSLKSWLCQFTTWFDRLFLRIDRVM